MKCILLCKTEDEFFLKKCGVDQTGNRSKKHTQFTPPSIRMGKEVTWACFRLCSWVATIWRAVTNWAMLGGHGGAGCLEVALLEWFISDHPRITASTVVWSFPLCVCFVFWVWGSNVAYWGPGWSCWALKPHLPPCQLGRWTRFVTMKLRVELASRISALSLEFSLFLPASHPPVVFSV